MSQNVIYDDLVDILESKDYRNAEDFLADTEVIREISSIVSALVHDTIIELFEAIRLLGGIDEKELDSSLGNS